MTAKRSFLLLAGAVFACWSLTAGARALASHEAFYWRTPVLALVALIVHLRGRSQSSVLTASCHLAAISSLITDLSDVGSWAVGWPRQVLVAHPVPTAAGGLVIAISTVFGLTRLLSDRRMVRRVLPLAAFSGAAGAALTIRLGVVLSWTAIGGLIAAVAMVWAVDLVRALSEKRSVAIAWPRHLDWWLALWVGIVAALLSRIVFDGVPHVPDEVAMWFQARYFAAGHLGLAPPADWAAFELPHTLVLNDLWVSIFPPGWPVVLAVWVLLRMPALANPAVAAATIPVLHRLLRRLYGMDTAHLGCALLALSPPFLLMSAGLMSHPFAAFCAIAAASASTKASETGRMRWAILGGLLINVLIWTRPFEGGLVTIGFAAYFAFRRVWQRGEARNALILLSIASSGLVVLFGYQFILTGKWLVDPITVYFDQVYYPRSNRLGFGRDIANFGWSNDALPGYSPLEAVINAHLNIELLNLELFAWPFGSLVAAALYAANWRRIGRSADVLFIAIGLTPVLGYLFYWYSGADYGARYWYQLLIPLVVLSGRAVIGLDGEHFALRRAALVCTAIACAVFLPWRSVTKYVGYRGMGASVLELEKSCDLRNGLVFVRSPGDGLAFGGYAAAAILNQPGFTGSDPVFVRDVSVERAAAIAAAWPGRRRWTIDVPADRTRTATVVEAPAGLSDAEAAGCGLRMGNK
jgi:hypothetical protein